jgi:hypothetical protein
VWVRVLVLHYFLQGVVAWRLKLSGPKEAHRGAAVAAAMGPKGD